MTRRMGKDLHPRPDDGVRLPEKVGGIGLLIRCPERMALWEREDEEGL